MKFFILGEKAKQIEKKNKFFSEKQVKITQTSEPSEIPRSPKKMSNFNKKIDL